MSQPPDQDLIAAALGGDSRALGMIYDRYADPVYSFALSRLRHREQAADATHETFVRVATRLDTLRDPARLKSWIFAIARNQIIDQARARARTTALDEEVDMAADQPDNDASLLAADSAQLLWDAADGLTDRDVELLELNLRHGLEGADLADALGVSGSHLHVLQSRVRDRVGKSLGALLIARHGQDDCRALTTLLSDWDGVFTIAVRSQVTRHVERCGVCEQTRKRVVTAGRLAAALPLTIAPDSLRTSTIDAMSQAMATGVAQTTATGPGPSEWSWREDGFPEELNQTSRRGLWLFRGAVALLALALLVAAVAWLGNGGAPVEDATQTSQGLATPDTATTAPTVPTTALPTTAPATTASPTTAASTTAASTTAAPGDTTAPVIQRLSVRPPICQNVPIGIIVYAEDDLAVTGARLTWSDADGSGDLNLIPANDDQPTELWSGDIPSRLAGTVDFTVTVNDEAGNTSEQTSLVDVPICPG